MLARPRSLEDTDIFELKTPYWLGRKNITSTVSPVKGPAGNHTFIDRFINTPTLLAYGVAVDGLLEVLSAKTSVSRSVYKATF